MDQYYVLFPNHENGIRLHKELKKVGIRARISPTPRVLSKCCGISLMIEDEDVEQVKKCIKDYDIEIIEIAKIKRDINPNRDRYC